jgi:hypothetical protein
VVLWCSTGTPGRVRARRLFTLQQCPLPYPLHSLLARPRWTARRACTSSISSGPRISGQPTKRSACLHLEQTPGLAPAVSIKPYRTTCDAIMPCVMRRFPVTLTIPGGLWDTWRNRCDDIPVRAADVLAAAPRAFRPGLSPPPPGQVRNLAPIASLNINSLSSERPGRIRFEQHLTPRTCLAATQQF